MKAPTSIEKIEEEHEKLWTIGSIGVQVNFGRFTSAKEIDRQFLHTALTRVREEALAEVKDRAEILKDPQRHVTNIVLDSLISTLSK